MKKILKNFFLANIKTKIACIILATLLWVFVASNQSLLGKFPNQIKIKTVNLSDQYQSFLDQDSVQVSVMAEPNVWRSLTSESFSASVDLAGLKEGTYELDVRVVSNVPDVQITKVEPAKVFVSIEKIISKSITLTPRVEGDPADGMVLGAIVLDPESVEVRGPSSYVDTISEANALIKLNGESESFQRDVTVAALTENSRESGGVVFSPATVLARVTIAKGGNNKTVGVRVRTKGNPKDNYYINKIVPTPATVDIIGQRSILANINFLETEEIDVAGLSDTTSRDVNLILPEGVSLQKGALQKVKVDISFAALGSTKTISANVIGANLADGLRLLSYSPSDVKVTVSGPQSLLTALSQADVRLELNMAGKGAGAYNVDLNISMLRLPDGVVATGITPSSLSVSLGN